MTVYPRAIRSQLGADVRHRNSQYLNNRIEQDHRGIKSRYGPMRSFGAVSSAARFCRCHDELRNLLHTNSPLRRTSPPATRRRRFLQDPHCRHRDGFVMSSAMKQSWPCSRRSSDGTTWRMSPESSALRPSLVWLAGLPPPALGRFSYRSAHTVNEWLWNTDSAAFGTRRFPRVPSPVFNGVFRMACARHRAMHFAENAKSDATRIAYASDWASWLTFCAARGATPLPGHPGVVAAFLSAQADAGRKAASIGRSAASIAYHH